MTLVANLERLAALRRDGILTDDEFTHAKQRLISTQVTAPVAPSPSVEEREKPPTRVEIVQPVQPNLDRVQEPTALVAFVLGLLSVVFYAFWFIPLAAFLSGGYSLIEFEEKKYKNKWMAVVGLVLGGVCCIMAMHKNKVFG